MNRLILTAAAVAFTFVLVTGTDTQANGPRGGTTRSNVQTTRTIHSNNLHSSFRASSYCGWNSYCWFGQCRCYGCYCPSAQCWYYWYAPMQCYLPISYMTIYPPTPFGAPGMGIPGIGVPPIAPMGAGLPGLPPGAAPVNMPPVLPASPVGELPIVP